MDKKDLLVGLTAAQKKAVTHRGGPILVVAGAGTGKTTVITRRVAWLIGEGLAKPEEVLALTFTEKAATEMTTRVDELSDWVYSGLSISTFHSFGADIISEYAFLLGLPTDYRVLTDVEQILFIKDHIFEFELKHYKNLSEPTSIIRELVKTLSRLKDENVKPKEYVDFAKKKLADSKEPGEKEEAEKQLEVAKAYGKYNELLRKEGYIDYGDQINLVLELLDKPSVAKKLRDRYKYALIDEFQDTNWAQNELVRKLFGEKGNVMAVGDDDQSIYRFRGAAVSNILDFRENYVGVKTVVLSENFRSTQRILDASYRLIQNNNPERLEAKYKIDKKLVSKIGEGSFPKLLTLEAESQEAEAVAEEIISLKNDGADYADMAILFRANKHAEEFVRTLKKHGIPFVFSGAAGLYEKIEVKMLIALVSALSNSEDDLALYHLSMSDVYNMNATELSKISHWAARRNKPLSKVFKELPPMATEIDISQKTVETAGKITGDLEFLREEAKTSTAGEVVNLFLRQSGYYSKLTREAKDGSAEAHGKISNIAAFFDKIIHFQRNYKDHSLKKFSEYLALILEAGDDPRPFEPTEGLSAVSLLSIHKAKGLEFETVFVSSLSDSHIPGRGRSEMLTIPAELVKEKVESETSSLNEERRLFYVAITRAKKNLYLTAALDYGTKKTHKISRFVLETLGEEAAPKNFLKTEPIERIKHFEKVENLYNIKLEPIPESEKIVLSRAQIDDWRTCPFKFQLIHITPIRIISDANVAYGNAVHNTIGEYYKRRMAGRKVKKNEVLSWFNSFWDESGFLSKDHEKERYETGRKALAVFFEKAEKEPMPMAIEKEFKFLVGNTIIRGRYDAIFKDMKEDRVVDFKTSRIKSQKEADERTKKSTQLATYALAYKELNGQLPGKVQLYFVENGLVGTYVPSEKDAEKTKEDILEASRGIRARDFQATPDLFTCRYCPFSKYCPVAKLEKTSS
jgi:DNA helicase-2/ATP-dependent DNA helicase PcrA